MKKQLVKHELRLIAVAIFSAFLLVLVRTLFWRNRSLTWRGRNTPRL